MNQINESPKWWRYLAKFLLVVTVCVVFICFLSLWAKDAEYFGKGDFGSLLVIGVYFMFSFVTLLGLVVLAVIGIMIGFVLEYPLKKYLIMFFLSLTSVLYINTFHS